MSDENSVPAIPGLIVTSWGGCCPFQADGYFNEFPFYFRARGGFWTLEVANPGSDPVSNGELLSLDGLDPSGGFMEKAEARRILEEGFRKFVAAK
jgi:hypothetical protein